MQRNLNNTVMKKLLSTMFLIVSSCFYAFSAEVTEDFETSYNIGETLVMNNPKGGTATVVANPSGGGKVLFLQNSDWNTVPAFRFTLPEGKTLGDCSSVSFSIYIPSDNSDGNANWKQRHVYLNGKLVYKDVEADGITDDYPNLGEMNSWAGQTISISQFDLTDEQKQLNEFTIAMGINDQKIHYYMDNVTVRYPFNTAPPVLPTQGAFDTDYYPNLFLAAGYTKEQVNQRLEDLWDTYFEGDLDNERLYYEVRDDMAYILDVQYNDVRSEGMSYGMMICVQLDKQEEFNKLWKWAKTYMQRKPGDEREGYFSWQLNPDGTLKDGSGNPASDGEEYFIMALMFASNRWGNEGIYNYEAEADYIIKNCFNKPMEEYPHSDVTNLFDMTAKQITFVPFNQSALHTDPSYHLPAFYELWARWAKEHNKDFLDFAAKSREMFPKFAHRETGLMPDYANYDGSPRQGEHQDFLYDAWRCIMNMAVDFSWFRPKGVDYTALVNRQHNFFASKGGVPNYHNRYTLDGQQIGSNTEHSPGLVACNAAGALASNQMVAWEFIDDFMATAIPKGEFRYYDGLLYYLNFLHVSGNFKIWKPKTGTGITDVSATPRIRIDGGVIRLGGNAGGRYRIVSLGGGTVVMSGDVPSSATIDIAALPRGIYAISIEGETLKFIK